MDEGEGNVEQAPKEVSRGGLRLLQFAAFFSSFDRFAVAPMLVTIAASLGTSLAEVTVTASLYYLLYRGCSLCGGCFRTGSGGCGSCVSRSSELCSRA